VKKRGVTVIDLRGLGKNLVGIGKIGSLHLSNE
jgi:hypothetical protein